MARALHYVFKIGDRRASYEFYTRILHMKILRHEEFEEGCQASCNGYCLGTLLSSYNVVIPYNGKWSKTMVGYGSEDDHFVIELTYNYHIKSYQMGNDYYGIYIESGYLYKSMENRGMKEKTSCGKLIVRDPDGHMFLIGNGLDSPRIVKVAVMVQNMEKSIDYWTTQLGMKITSKEKELASMSYGDGQCEWEVRQLKTELIRSSASGRVAFSYPDDELHELQGKIQLAHLPIIKELVTLETPGKANVKVIILADPDQHEICFVGDAGFRELSKIDPVADQMIRKEIEDEFSNREK
uniref:Glyoxalase domain-containing protein 4 n=1 Tax=Heterorhabditis bacteriophora TaxID=37862 RepID=A0A1I7XQL2_HETBA